MNQWEREMIEKDKKKFEIGYKKMVKAMIGTTPHQKWEVCPIYDTQKKGIQEFWNITDKHSITFQMGNFQVNPSFDII